MRPFRYWLVAACGGLLSAALPPQGAWPLLLTLVPLFVLVARSSGNKDAFRLGFLFALPFFTLHILWLPRSFSTPEFFGTWFWLLYPPLLLILSSFWGLVTLVGRALGGGGVVTLALLPPAWVLMEWARTQGYFAFPWGTLGYAWLDTPVIQLADTLGVWGLSVITTGAAALLAVPFVTRPVAGEQGRRSPRPWSWLASATALAIVVVAWSTGSARLSLELPPAEHSALLIQGNLDPFGRLQGGGDEVSIQAALTARGVETMPRPPDLVVWPEGAVLQGFSGGGGERRLAVLQASSPDSTFLVGARRQEQERSFNSAFTISGGFILDDYDKRYLVPFGERFPLADSLAPLYRAVFGLFGLAPLASTSSGEDVEPLQSPLGLLGAYICYESVFPQVQRELALEGASVLVNITNDAWFSRGTGAQQHYAMGSVRAIETRRYLLRAGNDGITGMVDPLGRTVAQLPRGGSGFLPVEFGTSTVLTPWVRHGWLLPPLLGLWLVLLSLWRFTRRASP